MPWSQSNWRRGATQIVDRSSSTMLSNTRSPKEQKQWGTTHELTETKRIVGIIKQRATSYPIHSGPPAIPLLGCEPNNARLPAGKNSTSLPNGAPTIHGAFALTETDGKKYTTATSSPAPWPTKGPEENWLAKQTPESGTGLWINTRGNVDNSNNRVHHR